MNVFLGLTVLSLLAVPLGRRLRYATLLCFSERTSFGTPGMILSDFYPLFGFWFNFITRMGILWMNGGSCVRISTTRIRILSTYVARLLCVEAYA